MAHNDDTQKSRRDFLKLAGTAPVAAAAATVATEASAEDAPTEGGLQDTAHVRTYYELARF